MERTPVVKGRNWMDPQGWPSGLQRCSGCVELLHLLIGGWGLPPRDGRSWEARFGEEAKWRQKRAQRLEKWREWFRENPGHPDGSRRLHYLDSRRTWAEAEMPESYGAKIAKRRLEKPGDSIPADRLDRLFSESQEDGREEDCLHPHIDQATVERMVDRVGSVLEHLEDLPTDELADHFTASFGEEWPPHLEEGHDVLTEWWGRYDSIPIPNQREANRNGVALRVATVLPFRGGYSTEGTEPEEYVAEECDLSYDQLRRIFDRPGEE